MSLQNINDPEGVKAVLDALRKSQAWTDALESGRVMPHPHSAAQPAASRRGQTSDSLRVPPPGPEDARAVSLRPSLVSDNPSSHSSHSTPSVAELLSQLRAPQDLEHTSGTVEGDRRSLPLPGHTNSLPVHPQTASTHVSNPQQDIRTLSFQQALPHISRLMEDSHVTESLTQLWEEREDIRRGHEEKVTVAKNKAKMIGVGLSKQEAQLMSDAFRSELRKFDTERVLPAWDGLIRSQQARFEALKIPTMYVTNDAGPAEVSVPISRGVIRVLSH
ncbi:hypothetical protein F5148DRAFT_148875 [Russula earlei]|uniref:Uncharacterized protein n=1 Tax=Russula earlei TaxID=71964 RepID=A0ACC0U652_9AGAM|nr:hypothetical protein F5148DRAFT_148875 [Russula earlei]